jgi:hypothetical protein
MQAIRKPVFIRNVALEISCAILVRTSVDFLGALPRLSIWAISISENAKINPYRCAAAF